MPGDFLDPYSRGATICHRMSPRLKILLTVAVIASCAFLPLSNWPLYGCLASLVFVAHTLAEIPISYLARRLALFLPLVLMTALAVPLSRGFGGGWDTAGTVVIRAVVAFLAALWLVNTTPFDRLLVGLSRLGLPRLFTALLAFAYRYIDVLFDELARMRTAQRARTLQRSSGWRGWKGAIQLLGMLLIRALVRAERIHGAMCSRGWTGKMHSFD
jgi:cobalt/nickel transport system permease protein